ncbi:Ribokinase [Strongyloides ratti]|uniref:Ribokinase n=1 Tax=Strongyloides ratti TaxID=34506 RepID=A0A090KTS6_STRRB|nr:Ribokinase [Strongyloides ratti]CEF60925.1 Ribokinase [Strongyloides ratti]
MSSPQILVVGSIITDLINYTDNFPEPGKTTKGKLFKIDCGGKGANQAVSAAKLGSNVKIIACVGNDVFGKENIKNIKDNGVNVDNVQIIEGYKTAVANIMIDKNGENITIVNLGANLELNANKIQQLENEIKNSSLIMLQNGISREGNLECMKIAQKYKVEVMYNAAPGIKNLDQEYLKNTDYLIVNENEAQFLSEIPLICDNDYIECALKLTKSVKKVVIITRGSNSTIVAINDKNKKYFEIKIDKVKANDTNGAGDCFCGAFASTIVTKKYTIKDSVIFASKVAALSVQRIGTQSSYPNIDEVNKILKIQ